MTFGENNSLPTPSQHLGFEVGADRRLAGWGQIVDYFERLDRASDRVKTLEIGRSTEGNPFLLTIISSARNIANLDKYKRIQRRLADPRGIADDAEAERLIGQSRAVAAVMCSIHATEVGATQMSLLLAHHLASADTDEVNGVLDDAILLLIPCMNPDGLIKVKRWYESTLGAEYEGVMPPFLYHKYTGHDNNRDWFMFTQRETRLAVEHCLNAWHPHVLLDMHQTRHNGSRMILPPFVDPVGPNVDAIIQAEIAMLGTAIAADMTAQGKAGVAVNAVYDAYSPNRTYQHYHGGLRLLSEAAGARIATPIEIAERDLQSDRGETPKQRTWNHPLPWRGGVWRLRDIVEYDFAAAYACLRHAGRLRETFARNFYRVGVNAVKADDAPYAFVVPPQQHDAHAAAEMLGVLRTGLVEIHEAAEAFRVDGELFAAGSRVILRGQPYWAYAKTLMEQRKYPELRTHEGGPPKKPYDVSSHCLPIQMGVNAYTIAGRFAAKLRLLGDAEARSAAFAIHRKSSKGAAGRKSGAYIIAPESNAAARVVNRLLAAGAAVYRSAEPLEADGAAYRRGAFVAPDAAGVGDAIGGDDALLLNAIESTPQTARYALSKPRIGIYKSYVPSIEEGWTRFVMEEYGFEYASLTDGDMREGGLGEHLDAIVLPHQRAHHIHGGHGSYYHPDYAGGLGAAGLERLREFVEGGGTLIAWDGAARYAIRRLELPVRDVVADLPRSGFYAPGSLLGVLLDTTHPLAYGMPSLAAVMFYDSPAFDIRRGRVVGKYPLRNPLFSGLLIGPEKLYNRAALASVPLGRGEVVLMGFRPHFRAQARGAYKLLFNALYGSAQTDRKRG